MEKDSYPRFLRSDIYRSLLDSTSKSVMWKDQNGQRRPAAWSVELRPAPKQRSLVPLSAVAWIQGGVAPVMPTSQRRWESETSESAPEECWGLSTSGARKWMWCKRVNAGVCICTTTVTEMTPRYRHVRFHVAQFARRTEIICYATMKWSYKLNVSIMSLQFFFVSEFVRI